MKRIFTVLLLTFGMFSVTALASENIKLQELQAEMLRLISTTDNDQFHAVTEQLKAESHKQGDERLFYIAW